MKSHYEYTENKKVKCYHSDIDGSIYYPYTYDKKLGCWTNRSGELSRQRINQLENEDENKIMWM
jgi:hypothetical protein